MLSFFLSSTIIHAECVYSLQHSRIHRRMNEGKNIFHPRRARFSSVNLLSFFRIVE